MADSSESVRVVVRCRPFNQREKDNKSTAVCEIVENQVSIRDGKGPADALKTFAYDAAFDMNSQQLVVYEKAAKSIVEAVLDGYNGTVFAYGQTGTGKTHTMQGNRDAPEHRGIILNAFDHIFEHIQQQKDRRFLVSISFLEIYNEEIRDLLSKDLKKSLELKENPEKGVYVKDLSTHVCQNVNEMEEWMALGNNNRSVAATLMNATSSRSHSIFTITVESCAAGLDGSDHIVVGKLNLVDLAGSERQSKTGAEGQRLKEAAKINLSLSCLGNCISALVDGKSTHIPYRDSKLTRLLQDSLGGNAKTLMIATISPADFNLEETISTLRYASRAKSIKNKPKINEDPKDAQLRQYQEEIQRLRALIAARSGGAVVQPQVPATKPPAAATNGIMSNVKSATATASSEATTVTNEPQQVLAKMNPAEIARIQADIDAERKALLESTELAIEEKERIAQELNQRQADLNREKQGKEELEKQLKELESKLVVGGVDFQAHVEIQRKDLEEKKKMVEEQEKKQVDLQKTLEQKQEEQMALEETYATLQEEVDVKSKKLRKLWSKLQDLKAEITDTQSDFRLEKEELLETIRELRKELDLKEQIIDLFIPAAHVARLQEQAIYDDSLEDWLFEKTNNLQISEPKNEPDCLLRPLCLYGRYQLAAQHPHIRYRLEKLADIPLYMPDRSTRLLASATPESISAQGMAVSRRVSVDPGEYGAPVKKSAAPPRPPPSANANGTLSTPISSSQEYPEPRRLLTANRRFA